jgi:uncharacterized protein YeaO (DUF488 family)
MAGERDEPGGDAACWAAQFDDPAATRVVVRGIDAADVIGRRVAVDAVAPPADADFDLWLPEVAPSAALMAWYAEQPDRWEAFQDAYRRDLDDGARRLALATLERLARQESVTLMTAAPDPTRSAAEVLRAALTERLRNDRW